MTTQYDGPKGGVLFNIEPSKRRPRGPEYEGKLAIEGDVATYIYEKLRQNETPEIRLAGWRRQGRNNTSFLSLTPDIPWADHPDNPQSGQASTRQPPPARGRQNGPAQDDGRSSYRDTRDDHDEIPF